MKMKLALALLAAAGMLSSTVAQAETPWLVRARAVYLDWDNQNKDGLQNVGVGKVEAETRWIPEVDISYFFTKNLAAELVLTWPQQVDIKTAALGKIGSVDALPPSLLLQYHFTDLGMFKPYVGVGLNYTLFTKDSFHSSKLGGAKVSVDNDSVGVVGQLGADFLIDKNWSVNVDVKYVQMETDVKLNNGKIGKLELNPVTWGIGVGYRF